MERGGYAYIITNKYHTVLYTGSTTNLATRIYQHKTKYFPNAFSAKYNLNKLVYYESHFTIQEAREREKIIKGWSRQKKMDLINKFNPEWKDLYDELEI